MQNADDFNQRNPGNACLLGEWQVFPDTGLLIKAGHEFHAEPIVMSVLDCLMQAGSRLVTRDELIEKVWAHVVVNDEVLTRAISELRTLLGDVSRERRYIATIPKRGYKLVMPVRPLTGPVDSIPGQIEHSGIRKSSFDIRKKAGFLWASASHLPGHLLSHPVALTTGGLTLSLMFMFSLWITTSNLDSQDNMAVQRAPDQSQQPGNLTPGNLNNTLLAELRRFRASEALVGSVETLPGSVPGSVPETLPEQAALPVRINPLTLITDDERTRVFAAGLSEDLQHAIYRQTDLQVVQQFSENYMDSALILSGSVRVYDQSTRVNFQLVEAVTSRLLWSSSFDCPLDALSTIQTQIARQAANHLQQSLRRKA